PVALPVTLATVQRDAFGRRRPGVRCRGPWRERGRRAAPGRYGGTARGGGAGPARPPARPPRALPLRAPQLRRDRTVARRVHRQGEDRHPSRPTGPAEGAGMTMHDPADLERDIGRALDALPPPRAPRSLLVRVMADVQA